MWILQIKVWGNITWEYSLQLDLLHTTFKDLVTYTRPGLISEEDRTYLSIDGDQNFHSFFIPLLPAHKNRRILMTVTVLFQDVTRIAVVVHTGNTQTASRPCFSEMILRIFPGLSHADVLSVTRR